MKFLLTTLNSKFIHTNLAIRYIRENCKDDVDVVIREYTINNSLDYILKDIFKGGYDAIAFSVYIWNVEDVIRICNNLKKVMPEVKIILGGPEVSYDPIEQMKKYDFVDYIICGEGEDTFRELAIYLDKKTKKLDRKSEKDILGICFRNGEDIVLNPERPLIMDLDKLPSPYKNLDPSEYKNKIVYYESSRGCPFNCQYCLSSTLSGLRFFSLDRVKEDLKNLIDAGVSQVKFIDRTFNADKRKSMDIMRFLMENDNGFTSYHFEVTAHLITDEMLEFLKEPRPGLFQFEIGVQTTNDEVLEEIGRRDDFDRLKKVVQKISSYRNIHQHLDLIAGLPGEDMNSFIKSFNDVFGIGVEVLQLGFLKLIKGTGIRNREREYDYIYRDYPPYEVLESNKMDFSDMIRLKDVEEVLETYFNSKDFILSVDFVEKNYFNTPFDFFDTFAKYLDSNGFFDVSHSRNSLFDSFYDFFENLIEDKGLLKDSKVANRFENSDGNKFEYDKLVEEQLDLFREVLKFDYCSSGRPSGAPRFMNRTSGKDIKDASHKFLKDVENLKKIAPHKLDMPAKSLIKKMHFEVFRFDVERLKKDIYAVLEREDYVIVFNYDIDKVFEKSKTLSMKLDDFENLR